MTPARTIARDGMVRRATGEDLGALSEIMAYGLRAQPTAAWLVPDRAARAAVLRRYAHLVLERAMVDGQVDTLDGAEAVAVWYSRVEPPAPVDAWGCDLQKVLGPYASRFALLHAYVDVLMPHTPHHFLAHLAVRPGQHGAARALLTGYHHRLDADKLPAYAEVSGGQPRESVFARLGYEVRSPILLEPGGPMLWRMWRPGSTGRRSDGLPCRVRTHRFTTPTPRSAVPATSPRSP
ncbi:N-acetyltransferase [Micromonospora sp. RP3T]|uniref:N-acetyltransferase n=1 Tax=Micromonospora sp. RP3T TaxID=2135446 RepID=UPI001E427E09|nr:N-acetyltransferase [Micromonospora sp. RP3T]